MKISVCICTRDRPESLREALESVASSEMRVHEVVVADDGDPSSGEVRSMCDAHVRVKYVRGPSRGLCANRNTALRLVTGDHVHFLDDDARVPPTFYSTVAKSVERTPQLDRTIVTGVELRSGTIVEPHDQTFLGFQASAYKQSESLQTVVMNATIFPATLFERIRFDERLAYGYDEVDISTRAVAAGYEIVLCREAVVLHEPSRIHRAANQTHVDASRLYVTAKRYALTDRKPFKAAAYLMVATAHMLAAGGRSGGVRGGLAGLRSASRGWWHLLGLVRHSGIRSLLS